MENQTIPLASSASNSWLKRYYFARFAFSAAWVAAAFTVAKGAPALAAALLVAYPAWDALANFYDARRHGGLDHNRSQMLNFVVSALTALAVAIALTRGLDSVLAVFGVWAVLSGLLQLATGLRRWKAFGAQWAMILSGAQSALAGVFFVKMASGPEAASILNLAPYAAFGAFYFFVSAIWLTVSEARRAAAHLSL